MSTEIEIESSDNIPNVEKKPEESTNNTNLTFSTKMSSTDQLICKTPATSSTNSLKSNKNNNNITNKPIVLDDFNENVVHQIKNSKNPMGFLLYSGVLHFLFGFLMVAFGCLVIHYDANLSQLGGGIWAGCLSMSCGITGILASAKEWCPLKSTPQRITHTIFLVLSLISLAISQLIMALAAIGALRDFNNSDYDIPATETPPGKIAIVLPDNYMAILCNFGLLLTSLGEFIISAVTSYRSSRLICPCFQRREDRMEVLGDRGSKNALVSSWLGKMNAQQPMYVVAPSNLSTLSKHSQISTLTPIYAIPAPQMRYPLIPAPLGVIPSPHIPPQRRRMVRVHRQHKKRYPNPKTVVNPQKSKKKTKQVTDADVVKTYTGLDKTIAEEFIDICDSRNPSSCNSSSCNEIDQCNCTNNGSDGVSREYLVNNS